MSCIPEKRKRTTGGDAPATGSTIETEDDTTIASILRMAQDRKIQDLAIAADAIAERHDSIEEPLEGWDAHLPKWTSKGAKRGLKSWGSPTAKRGKAWEVNGLCRYAIQKAFDFYVQNIGVPPVRTGVLPTKKKQQKRLRGLTRGQEVLVSGAREINMFDTFVIVVRAKYSQLLEPPVEEGTVNYDAIYALLKQDGLVHKRAVSSVCVYISIHLLY